MGVSMEDVADAIGTVETYLLELGNELTQHVKNTEPDKILRNNVELVGSYKVGRMSITLLPQTKSTYK